MICCFPDKPNKLLAVQIKNAILSIEGGGLRLMLWHLIDWNPNQMFILRQGFHFLQPD